MSNEVTVAAAGSGGVQTRPIHVPELLETVAKAWQKHTE